MHDQPEPPAQNPLETFDLSRGQQIAPPPWDDMHPADIIAIDECEARRRDRLLLQGSRLDIDPLLGVVTLAFDQPFSEAQWFRWPRPENDPTWGAWHRASLDDGGKVETPDVLPLLLEHLTDDQLDDLPAGDLPEPVLATLDRVMQPAEVNAIVWSVWRGALKGDPAHSCFALHHLDIRRRKRDAQVMLEVKPGVCILGADYRPAATFAPSPLTAACWRLRRELDDRDRACAAHALLAEQLVPFDVPHADRALFAALDRRARHVAADLLFPKP